MAMMLAALVVFLQEKAPAADDAWLRFKVGSWMEHQFTMDGGGIAREFSQKHTLKKKNGDDYVVSQTGVEKGKEMASHESRSSVCTVAGKESLTINGKEYPCVLWSNKVQTGNLETEKISWMPPGNKYPLRVVFKQAALQGDITAIALDEQVKVGDREYTCAKLEGNITFQGVEGVMTVWMSQSFPGARVRSVMVLKGEKGEVVMRHTPIKVHEAE